MPKQPMTPVIRCLIWSQIALFAGLAVCILLIPHFLVERNEGGVSNYGLYAKTVVPFSLAFLLCGGLVLQAARLVLPNTRGWRQFRALLYGFGSLLLLVLASTYPYKLSNSLTNLHIGTAILLFWFETGASLWLALRLCPGRLSAGLLAGELAGFGLAVLTLFGHLHVLLVAQLITSLAFGLLLIVTARRLRQMPERKLKSS